MPPSALAAAAPLLSAPSRRCPDMAQAEQALRIARNRYRNGSASCPQALDAQRRHYATEQGLPQLRGALLAATWTWRVRRAAAGAPRRRHWFPHRARMLRCRSDLLRRNPFLVHRSRLCTSAGRFDLLECGSPRRGEHLRAGRS
jgi:hypothetical protein